MATINAKRGLDLPIHGAPTQDAVEDRLDVKRVALLPQEFHGAKVRLLAQEGDDVRVGTPLFCDRRDEDVLFTSPVSGKVVAVNRGHRRAVLSIVVESNGSTDEEPSERVDVEAADAETIRGALACSGLWTSIRRRPFDQVARTTDEPVGIVVQAFDSNPLSPDPVKLVEGRDADVLAGLKALAKLTPGKVHLCTKDGRNVGRYVGDGVTVSAFKGPHPAGTPGFSIHKLCPAGAQRVAWHVGLQDVADIGRFLLHGKRPPERVVAITGPAATHPRLVRTRPGASLSELLADQVEAETPRFVNGSLVWGTKADPAESTDFLGRWTPQVTILEDAVGRDLLGWALPVSGRFTLTNTVWDKFFRKRFKYDTDTNGSLRAIVPTGQYESVLPHDVLATQLIKALASGDLESAEKLGVLELAEEDLALCQVVDHSKVAITDMLRDMLITIEKEG